MLREGNVKLLLIEDDQVDVLSFQRELRRAGLENPVHVAADGVEALEMLRGEHGRERLEPPFVIVLDLNLPRMGGLQFLDELRADPELSSSVVFVLTTSNDDGDKSSAYRHHIAGYMVKTALQGGTTATAQLLSKYMSAVELPQLVAS